VRCLKDSHDRSGAPARRDRKGRVDPARGCMERRTFGGDRCRRPVAFRRRFPSPTAKVVRVIFFCFRRLDFSLEGRECTGSGSGSGSVTHMAGGPFFSIVVGAIAGNGRVGTRSLVGMEMGMDTGDGTGVYILPLCVRIGNETRGDTAG